MLLFGIFFVRKCKKSLFMVEFEVWRERPGLIYLKFSPEIVCTMEQNRHHFFLQHDGEPWLTEGVPQLHYPISALSSSKCFAIGSSTTFFR